MKLLLMISVVFVTIALLPAVSFSDNVSVVKVRNVEGFGASHQLALADAFRNAISQALGTYVVTSRRWDGETLDKKIFENSDAVVTKYEITAEKEIGKKCNVIINADIVRNEMLKYIHREPGVAVGEGEIANLLAKRKAIDNAVNSLGLIFQDWRNSIYRAEKVGNISIASNDIVDSDIIQLSVPFVVTFKWDQYRIFLSKIRNVISCVALAKTEGIYDPKYERDFQVLNYDFYKRLGLLYKTEDGEIRKTENPNGYGEVRFVSGIGDDRSKYEVFIVPNQIKLKLAELLERDMRLRFSFKSKGGDVVASQYLNRKLYSTWWDYICDDDPIGSWDNLAQMELVSFSDVIKVDFGRDNTCRKLYHASVPVPVADASRISECAISIEPQEKDLDCIEYRCVITEEVLDEVTWSKIDKKPIIAVDESARSTNHNKPIEKRTITTESVEHNKATMNVQPTSITCAACKGTGKKVTKCLICSGSGVCKYGGVCRNGRRLVQRLNGDYYENCRGCRGTGRCAKCSGRGVIQSACSRCRGKGVRTR